MEVNGLLEAASFKPRLLPYPSAWLGHIPFAAWLVKASAPSTIVELGTHAGHSYFSFCQAVAESNHSSNCFAIDTWQGDEHAGHYSDHIYEDVSRHNRENYASFSHLLRMTFDEALSSFADGTIDILHIDGLHTYEAVRHDFYSWLPKLAPGAIVLFHDTYVRERDFGVWRLWSELQEDYPNNLEFMHSSGLGVLQLNDVHEERKLGIFGLDLSDKEVVLSYFSALGSSIGERENIARALIDSQAMVGGITASKSWRVTLPLRFVNRKLKKFLSQFLTR